MGVIATTGLIAKPFSSNFSMILLSFDWPVVKPIGYALVSFAVTLRTGDD